MLFYSHIFLINKVTTNFFSQQSVLAFKYNTVNYNTQTMETVN